MAHGNQSLWIIKADEMKSFTRSITAVIMAKKIVARDLFAVAILSVNGNC